VPCLAWARGGRIDGLGVTGPMAERACDIRERHGRRCGRDTGEECLQHDQPYGNDHDAMERVRGRSHWHGNLSHGTLSQHMLQNHLRWQDAIAWPIVNRL
jgi:hypothetical protein